jgi:hypothetical protein
MTPANGKPPVWLVVLLVPVLLVGVPVVWFVLSHLKQGYDEAQRTPRPPPSASAASTAAAETKTAPDLGATDLTGNTTDVHDKKDHFAAKLPPLDGAARNGTREGMVSAGAFEVRGTLEEMHGASTMRLPSAPSAGGLCTLEISVEHGVARAYLLGLDGHVVQGHVFVDATPGHPGRVIGYLEDWSNTSSPEQSFVLEARDGAARGVSYRVYRR